MRIEFLPASLVVVLLPGTGVLRTLAIGPAPGGLWPGIAAAFAPLGARLAPAGRA